MNKIFNYSNLVLICRIILGLVFIYASLDKIGNPVAFSDIIDNYNIPPKSFNNIIALVLPFVELIIGILLIFGVFLEGSSTISIAMMILFILALSQAIVRGIDTHCGCFDTNTKSGDVDYRYELIKQLIKDIGFLGMAVIINLNSLKRKKIKLNEKNI